jgi:crossover junction endodeoxyribonuclease RuvC
MSAARPRATPGTLWRRVLGVDPGLAVTGYGVVDGDGVEARLTATGVIRTRPRRSRPQRLAEIFAALGRVIDECHPDDLAIEQHYVATNVRSAMAIGEARAAAMLAAAMRGMEVHEYPATTIKKTVTGYGGAPKEQVQSMVAMHLGLSELPQPLDASDAIAVALTRLAALRMDALLARRA